MSTGLLIPNERFGITHDSTTGFGVSWLLVEGSSIKRVCFSEEISLKVSKRLKNCDRSRRKPK